MVRTRKYTKRKNTKSRKNTRRKQVKRKNTKSRKNTRRKQVKRKTKKTKRKTLKGGEECKFDDILKNEITNVTKFVANQSDVDQNSQISNINNLKNKLKKAILQLNADLDMKERISKRKEEREKREKDNIPKIPIRANKLG